MHIKKIQFIIALILSLGLALPVVAANVSTTGAAGTDNSISGGAGGGSLFNTNSTSGGAGSGVPSNSITGSAGSGVPSNSVTGSAGQGLVQPSSGSTAQPATGGSSGLKLTASELSVGGIVGWFIKLLNYVVQLIIALALVAFLWGIFRLVFLDAGNTAEREKARKFMLWGICALFVMVSVWGLVNVLKTTVFGGGSLIIPQLK
jgi:Type IV secretion system pilin